MQTTPNFECKPLEHPKCKLFFNLNLFSVLLRALMLTIFINEERKYLQKALIA